MRNIPLPENKFLKLFILFWGVVLGLYFLPFILGGFFLYFIYKNIDNLIIRNAILVAIALPTLLFGGIWVAGITQGTTTPPAVKNIPSITTAPSPTLVPTATIIPSPTASSQNATPTVKPTTPAIQSVKKVATPTVAPTVFIPEPTIKSLRKEKENIPLSPFPAQTNSTTTTTTSGYSCNCAKTCTQMSSCAEAQYQLNSCGCSARDADHDGVACDAQCQ